MPQAPVTIFNKKKTTLKCLLKQHYFGRLSTSACNTAIKYWHNYTVIRHKQLQLMTLNKECVCWLLITSLLTFEFHQITH